MEQTITIKEYLTNKGIQFKESNGELVTQCLFNKCDSDSKAKQAHLYFSTETGQYNCKKCGEKGNLATLAKHFRDNNIFQKSSKSKNFSSEIVEKCHQDLPAYIRQYLNNRGILNDIINKYKLGWGNFYKKNWITIPIKDSSGIYNFLKLREDPSTGSNKMTYPKNIEAQIYDWEILDNANDRIIICEGELDRLLLLSKGIPAITSTHGAMTFKNEWAEKLKKVKNIYICFDNDDTGRKGAERVAKSLLNLEIIKIHIITLPKEVGEKGDITDYFIKLNGTLDDLLNKYSKEYPEKIDITKFKPLSSQDLIDILGLTIKKDEENKLVTFLCELSAYTEDSQFNISYNAPSSTGKSFIPTQIAKLFPQEDVMELAYCSPTAFFHDAGEFNKEINGYVVDLSHKIIIFLDQPHNDLLARLRPLLSHDKKEITLKITDKTQKFGLKTKNILLKGYPSVIFCTAGLKIDEQEATRFLLLSPEINQDKIKQSISEIIKKAEDNDYYEKWLEEKPERKLIKERIKAIKVENIKDIKIGVSQEKIKDRFLKQNKILKPRHQRDISRFISIVKSFALLNLWWRDKKGTNITANENDIDEALKIWNKLSSSQELNLPPYIYNLYHEVILTIWYEKNGNKVKDIKNMTGLLGLSRQEILQKHYDIYGRMLDASQLRQQILPMLETTGLITQEQDIDDKRKMLIYPIYGIK